MSAFHLWRGGLAGVIFALVSGLSANAQDTVREGAPLEAYGSLPAYDLVEVSASGDRMAYITTVGEDRSLIINDLNDMSVIGGVRAGEVKVRDIGWIGEDDVYLLSTATQAAASLGMRRAEFADVRTYDIPTRNVAMALSSIYGPTGTLNRTAGALGKVFGAPIVRTIDGEPTLMVPGLGLRGLGLYRVDLTTGAGHEAHEQDQAGSYLLDEAGELRARVRYDGDEWELQARRAGFWRTVWRTDARIDTPGLAGFGQAADEVVLAGAIDGRPEGYYSLNLQTGEISSLPFEGRVTALVHHPRTRLLVGAAIEGEGDRTIWRFVDPVAERTWRSVQAAFPNQQVALRSWSADLRQIIVFTQGEGDSGTWQLVDLDRRSAEIVGEAYPDIQGDRVGRIMAISYPAADGMRIPGYLTLPPGVTEPAGLPLVVLPHGGPAARDTVGFDWWAQAQASRGYVVLQPNFRGSDGLGKAHLEAGFGEWGRKMQTDLSDGVRWLAAQGWIDPARVCIVGASYGGYAAMAGPTLDQGVYSCAVSVAGVSDLRRMVQWEADQGGRRDSPAVRYWNRFMGADRLGDRNLDAISPTAQAARADAPILLLHGRDDTVVPIEQSRFLAEALQRAGKPYEFVELTGEDHWLSRAATRRRMLAETVRFLEAHNPPR